MTQPKLGDGVQTYLTVSVRREGESTVVELGGELDLGSSPQLSQALEHASREEPKLVVIDLRGLHFIDVAGLRVLLEAQEATEERGGRFMLKHVRRPVQRVLSLAQMSDAFTISNNHH